MSKNDILKLPKFTKEEIEAIKIQMRLEICYLLSNPHTTEKDIYDYFDAKYGPHILNIIDMHEEIENCIGRRL